MWFYLNYESTDLQGRDKLYSADKGKPWARVKVQLQRINKVGRVNLDVHKHIEHLDALCLVDRD